MIDKLVSGFIHSLIERIEDENSKNMMRAMAKEIGIQQTVYNFLEEKKRRNKLQEEYMQAFINQANSIPTKRAGSSIVMSDLFGER